jgi:upstream activation factor subunit UAF30
MRLQVVEPPTDWGEDLGDPIAVLRVEPEQLTRETGVMFVRGYDDLDYVRVAAVSLSGGQPFLLVRHEGKPQGGTEIVPSRGVSRDISSQLVRLLDALQLGPQDVAWSHPQISLTRRRSPKKTPRRSSAVGSAPVQKKRVRAPRAPSAGFMKPLKPDATLAEVVGSKPLPRTEVAKKLWAYIKKQGLQDSRNRRMINADAKLNAVFGGKRKVSMFEMTKLISKHLK